MDRSPPPFSQGHLMMAGLAVVWQAIQSVTTLARGDWASGVLSVLGLAASLGAAALLYRKDLPETTIRRLAVPAAGAWLLAQLVIDLAVGRQVAVSTHVDYLLVVTLAFGLWPARTAGQLMLLLGAVLLGASLWGQGTDLLVLNSVYFTAALIGYMSVYNTHLREAQHRAERARAMMVRDGVTGLLGREAALAQVEDMQASAFPDAAHLAVILLQVPELAQINQLHGYGSGDRTLQMVSIVLVRQCGPQDIVARWSGTKFLLTLRNANRREAQGRLEQILNTLDGEAWPGGPRLNIRAELAMLADGQNLHEVTELVQARLKAGAATAQTNAPLGSAEASPPRPEEVI